jgi:hypothetical protein
LVGVGTYLEHGIGSGPIEKGAPVSLRVLANPLNLVRKLLELSV